MIRATAITFALISWAGQCLADNPRLRISITDGDPHDRIRLINIGDCTVVSGVLSLDFTQSQGKIVIDTQYGGVGTKDPMPVAVESGPITVAPVYDGDTGIAIGIDGLIPNGQGVVTLDLDNNASGWFARRVSILSDDLQGTRAGLGDAQATFGASSTLDLPLPQTVCIDDEPPEVIIPIS